MQYVAELTPSHLTEFLLTVAIRRPVMVWGQPGIGKSALVEGFARDLGLECVSLLGSQLAPEDLIGVPQVVGGKSRFHPPAMIARDEAYCLFLDEVNGASHEVQRAFYSLIHERRVGDYRLPPGSIIIAAGNRLQDAAIVRPLSSALINRMVHVQLRASFPDWLAWAQGTNIHPLVLDYLRARPDHLSVAPPKTEEPFSTPRSWHMLSDALRGHAAEPSLAAVERSARGCLSAGHAERFVGFAKQVRMRFDIHRLLKGEMRWPDGPGDRDVLYFLAESLRAHLVKSLPPESAVLSASGRDLAHRGKALIKDLAQISLEVAQMMVAEAEDGSAPVLPGWFLLELVRDLPRLAAKAG